jgi:hypothetical protein
VEFVQGSSIWLLLGTLLRYTRHLYFAGFPAFYKHHRQTLYDQLYVTRTSARRIEMTADISVERILLCTELVALRGVTRERSSSHSEPTTALRGYMLSSWARLANVDDAFLWKPARTRGLTWCCKRGIQQCVRIQQRRHIARAAPTHR